MVFSSISFIFFILPLFLLLDSLGRRFFSISVRNALLLAVSLLFYTWGESTTVLILVGYGLFNYWGGRFLERTRSRRALCLFIAGDLSGLFVYKYLFWLVASFCHYVLVPYAGYSGEIPKGPSLPIGISFFTFQAMSYLVDIYRGKIRAAVSARDFMAYLCMFPHLVAGPIVRYETISRMLLRRGPDMERFSFGVYRFLIGLNKKVLIANSVAPLANAVFDNAGAALGISTFDAWVGMFAYGLQIYFDFSGYSDMAIGLASMGGFRFDENFLHPYRAASITEFWRRWHISLSSWFRDYVYIPLGGNRCDKGRAVFNKMAVFFLCGLWHGANLTFVLWGLWHGLLLLMESLFPGRKTGALGRLAGRGYVLLAVFLGWVLFRADNISDALSYYSALVFSASKGLISFDEFPVAFVAGGIGLYVALVPRIKLLRVPDTDSPDNYSFFAFLLQTLLAVFAVGTLFVGSRNPFIYFNF